MPFGAPRPQGWRAERAAADHPHSVHAAPPALAGGVHPKAVSMPRVGWLPLVFAIAAGGAVAAIPRPPLGAAVRTATNLLPADDPFPIRRVRGTNARLPELLKELEPGPTVRLPRAEFESRVRAAGRAALAAKHAARLVDATYAAELDGADLTGTAELGVLNAHGVTGFVPLDPLRLAIRGAKWADGRSAILAVPAVGAPPAVWVDRDGRNVLQLNWSLAGTTEPGERRFELRVPPCPAATLELTLPADQVPTAPADVLLTGPFESPGKPGRRMWRMRFGGRAKAEFAVRAAGQSGGTSQAKLVAKYDLAPGQLTAAFEYELRPARGSAAEWTFLADPGLRITDAVTNNRAGWTVDPPAAPGGPRRVRVTLRQPAPGGKVLVTAVAPFPDPTRAPDAPLPAVRPLNAVLDDEKLEVRLASGLKIESWGAGDYRLTDAPHPAPGAADQSRTLALVGTLLPPGADEPFRRMPSVRTTAAEAEFTTFERLEWDLDPARSVLAARVNVRVRRGPLFQIALRPPAGFQFDRGASGTDELVSHVGALAGGLQVLEFARPLAAGQSAELRLEFRGPGAKPGEPRPFPALGVIGAAARDGWLSISTEPAWTVAARPGAGAAPGGLWGWFTADVRPDARALFVFRGKEPEGTAALIPARAALIADATVRLDIAGGEWTATTRFAITSTGSSLPTAAVFVPGAPDKRSWKLIDDTNAVVDATPVPRELLELAPLFVPFDPRAGIAGARARAETDGTLWVLRFARPLGGSATLETTAPFGSVNRTGFLRPPRLLGAKQTTRAEAAPALKDRAVVGKNPQEQIFSIHRPLDGPMPVSDAYLVTAVRGPGEVLVAFGGTVRDTRGGALRLFLPPGAEVRGVCVAGRWLNPAACAERDLDALRVPIPAGAAVRFEARYRLPVEPGWPTRRIRSHPPNTADGSVFPVKRWWAFAPGVLPGWPARPWDATADEPPLLGGPLSGGEPFAVVTRSDDEWVRVGESRTADALAGAWSAVLLVIGLIAARRRRARSAVALASIVVLSLLAVEIGPPWWARVAWPSLCAATVALAVVLVAGAVRSRAPVSALAAVLLFLIPALVATAQPSVPATVLILTTDSGEEIIAARATLDRIDALAKPRPPAPVVTAATYDVRADGTGARVTAKFVVHAFRSGDNTLSLTLGDARLERATVDGAPAFPASPQPNTYTLAIGGPGRHEVELRFAATVTATGPERDLRFGVPEVPEAKLTAALPGAARQPVAPGRVGRQTVTTGGERTTLEADLGATKTVHLRWREGTGGAAKIQVREACVWDVTESGADLTAAYLVRVEQGALAGLRFEIPAELDVLRVAARTIDAPTGPVPLRDWALAAEKAAFRLLRVDFQAPASGRLLVVLECAPRKPLTRQPVLRFPRVSFTGIAGETDAVYGLRASRVTIDGVGLVNVLDFPADALKDFAAVPDLRLDPLNPVRAFKPAPGVAAELRPALHIGGPAAVRTATAWHVGPHRADATGTISWQSKEPLSLLEFTVPAVRVLEVRGPDVASWSQSGGRVQVWLRGGAREGAVEWTATTVPAPPDGLSFDPAHPTVARARHVANDVRVKPVAGWAVKADRARGWQSSDAAAGELRFHTDLPAAPPLRVQLSPLPAAPIPVR
jgi:hypothetical protein